MAHVVLAYVRTAIIQYIQTKDLPWAFVKLTISLLNILHGLMNTCEN